MSLNKQPYKGTRDFFPAEKRVLDYLFSTMQRTAWSFGYESYDGPLLEEVALYQAKSGQELVDEQIYCFYDRGQRHLAIRPEMTPTLARMVAQVHRETPKPLRWFSLPNLYRYERPQRGRLREHWQLNVDIFGATQDMGEAEVLQMLVALMKNFCADESMFSILVNDRRVTDFVLQQYLGLEQKRVGKLYKMLDKYRKVDSCTWGQMVGELGLDGQQKDRLSRYLDLDSFGALFEFWAQSTGKQEKPPLFSLYQLLGELGLERYLVYDPTIVRGIDYYSGVVFEVFDRHPDNRRAICGGGAYGGLLQKFGEPPLPGVGFGLGEVTLRDFLTTHDLLPDVSRNQVGLYLASLVPEGVVKVLRLGAEIRSHHLSVLTELSALKGQKAFDGGKKHGARFIGLVGDRELAVDEIKLKDLQTQKATVVKLDQVDEIIRCLSLEDSSG